MRSDNVYGACARECEDCGTEVTHNYITPDQSVVECRNCRRQSHARGPGHAAMAQCGTGFIFDWVLSQTERDAMMGEASAIAAILRDNHNLETDFEDLRKAYNADAQRSASLLRRLKDERDAALLQLDDYSKAAMEARTEAKVCKAAYDNNVRMEVRAVEAEHQLERAERMLHDARLEIQSLRGMDRKLNGEPVGCDEQWGEEFER